MMNIKDKYNKANEILDNTNIDERVEEFIYFAKSTSFERYLEGWICEKDELVENVVFFLERGEIEKSKYITWMLNTYYKGSTEELFNEMLSNEEYENLEIFKNFKDINTMPIV